MSIPCKKITRGFFLAACSSGLILLCLPGCRRATKPSAPEQPLVQTARHEGIELTLSADPPRVRLEREVWLTIRITSPTNVEVSVPPIDDRLAGLVSARQFQRDPMITDGRVTREICCWLTPKLADEYRVAPMAISFRDLSVVPAREGWFPTKPFVLPLAPVREGPLPGKIAPPVAPRWIRPSNSAIVWLAVTAFFCVAIAAIIWRLSRGLTRAIVLRRLSPRERALRELAELLARNLPARAKIKEFYLEITRIVRKYIERSHGIRAPEQTTEEFLGAVVHNLRFDPDSINKLREFLTAADLVKFAALIPDRSNVEGAADTAREYIVADADKLDAAAKSTNGAKHLDARKQNSK